MVTMVSAMKVYLDNVIASGKVRRDLPGAEMTSVEELLEYEHRGLIEIVTSRESWREQERTPDPATLEALRQARPDVPVVPYDHEVFGFRCIPDRNGGFISNPAVTDVIAQPLFDDLRSLGLKDADARHLMYAARNNCPRFVTLDGDFLNKRQKLEVRYGDLRIMKPSELCAELSPHSPCGCDREQPWGRTPRSSGPANSVFVGYPRRFAPRRLIFPR